MHDLFLALREARPYPMGAFAIISTIVAIALFAEAGLPIAIAGYGVYWLVRRRRKGS